MMRPSVASFPLLFQEMLKKVRDGTEMNSSIDLAHPLSSNWFQKFCAGIGANQKLRPHRPVLASQSCLFTKVENFQIKHRGPMEVAKNKLFCSSSRLSDFLKIYMKIPCGGLGEITFTNIIAL